MQRLRLWGTLWMHAIPIKIVEQKVNLMFNFIETLLLPGQRVVGLLTYKKIMEKKLKHN